MEEGCENVGRRVERRDNVRDIENEDYRKIIGRCTMDGRALLEEKTPVLRNRVSCNKHPFKSGAVNEFEREGDEWGRWINGRRWINGGRWR